MKFLCPLIVFLLISAISINAQLDAPGDAIHRAKNVHAGNQIRITFHNNGRLGTVSGDQSVAYTGEWPIGTGYVQMGNTSAYVMTEMRLFTGLNPVTGDSTFEFITPAIFCEGWDPNMFSHDSLGMFLGFEPVPGYFNLTQKEKDPGHSVAMSQQAFTWPPYWPDKLADAVDAGWANHWNGYFGKDQLNADEESYYVMDDNKYRKQVKGLTLPTGVSEDPTRGGLGLRTAVRGLQWSNPDAADCLFWIYKIRNFGDLYLDKTLFGCNVGASSGGRLGESGDYDDDGARFYREKGLAVNFDLDNVGIRGYSPVPWVGFAFLESPGNFYDGIDNDGDGNDPLKPGGGTGKIISEQTDFYKFYAVGDPIVLVDYESDYYDRTVSTMPTEGITLTRNGSTFIMKPNAPLIEEPRNGFDDNLNGLIDESDGSVTQDSVEYYLYIRSEYNDQDYLGKDYVSGSGLSNLLIDERRDDLQDNDGDWSLEFDDVGLDGKPGTGDFGEGDGSPTPGTVDLPGEPNVDKVDVDESDQIGLTSFKFYIYSSLLYSNDDQMWDYSRPGYFDNTTTGQNDYDYVFASGYFPLRPGQEEFFSVAMIYGWDEIDILRNKDVVQKIYNSNYNFAIAPLKPKVTAVAGDKKVTLYWDEKAEASYDRYLRTYDFEGYKIYKSSHHTFGDAGTITDGLGYERFKKPIATYDRADSVFGYFPNDFGSGVLFNLGNESGLVHSFEDTDVLNGIRYYYAVTAYDKGDVVKNIGPSECTIFVNVDQSGNITLGENVVTVTPQAPSLGYESPEFDIYPQLQGEGITSGTVGVNIVDPTVLGENDEYELQFLDVSMDGRDNDLNGLVDENDPNELVPNETTGFILKNLTQQTESDSIWLYEYKSVGDSIFNIQNLYNDNDGDPRTLSKVLDGLELVIYNPESSIIDNPQMGILNGIKWSENIGADTSSYPMNFTKWTWPNFVSGTPYPRQYKIVFYDEIVDTSTALKLKQNSGGLTPWPAVPVNFKVYDQMSGDEVNFGFNDITQKPVVAQKGHFSAKDIIVFYEKLKNDSTLITYMLQNLAIDDTTFFNKYGRTLGAGDTLSLFTDVPFGGTTKYNFKIRGQKINAETAKNTLGKIKVVPNPYVVTAVWEPHNPYTTGRGPRAIQFINLPQECTIRIFAVDGTLVRTLDHQSTMTNGSETWDLMSKDNMDVSYGVYVYHVDAPGIGQHVGRILIIK
ncbi:MAG: hypothetical protein V1720_10835 [bacterium]